MLVVSDATPLNVLIRAGCVDVLDKLFGQVVITPAVAEELTRDATPPVIRDWMQNKPPWVQIRSPAQLDPGTSRNRGEREAISLAKELKADLLLIDDRRARIAAERLEIPCVGTIGILEAASAKALLNLRDALIALPQDFLGRVDPKLIEDSLARDEWRKRK